MAVPGFTAEAALYPTSGHYRTLGLGVPEPAQRGTANALQSRLRRRTGETENPSYGCYSHCHQAFFSCVDGCGFMGVGPICLTDCEREWDLCDTFCSGLQRTM
jgi:hypothetical protein